MTLTTQRLILRPFRESDAASVYRYAQDPEVGPAAGWPPHTSVANSRDIVRDILMVPGTWAITLKDEDLAIGCISLAPVAGKDPKVAQELGFWLGKPFWNQGIMTEAATCVIDYGFSDLNLQEIWCGYHAGNERSKHLQHKFGFTEQSVTPVVIKALGNARRERHFNKLTKETWLRKSM